MKLTRVPSLKNAEDFRRHAASLGIELPCDDQILTGGASPLAQPADGGHASTASRSATAAPSSPWKAGTPPTSGGVTEPMLRRWQRFGQSGAKLIFGGRSHGGAARRPGQSRTSSSSMKQNKAGLATLRETLVAAHKAAAWDDGRPGHRLSTHALRAVLQAQRQIPPRTSSRPSATPSSTANSASPARTQVWTDSEIDRLIEDYVRAAKIAWDVGADFVDIKHCHGYLLHEFLGARTRPGKYGGSFENRTRILREIVSAIRADGNPIDLAVRLSAFDFVPFRPDPALSRPGKPGPGIPEDFSHCLPYHYAFGVNVDNPLEYDLSETFEFVELCRQLGVKILNLTAGSPYYNPHIQRPAAYPPSDGYQPPEDPLIGVARQVNAVRQVKGRAGAGLLMVGSAYSYLQEFLPQVAQCVVRNGWTDLVGIGRMVLAYPDIFTDALTKGRLEARRICRTFSDCTTAPRNGLISGCYPLDTYYSSRPEFGQLKRIKGS